VNQVSPLPDATCVAKNKENPYYCLLAEHLVKYIEAPIFITEALYDVWQLSEILKIPCMQSSTWPPDLNNCKNETDQLVEIHKFANYTRDLL
jgi:hypothetical protein